MLWPGTTTRNQYYNWRTLEVEIRKAILKEMSTDGYNPQYATSLMDLATALQSQGRHDEALDLREKALAFRRRVRPADHPDIAATMGNTAGSYLALGHHTEALDLYEETLAFVRRVLAADHPDIAISLSNVAATLTQTSAIWFVREAMHILKLQFSAFHLRVIHISMFHSTLNSPSRSR